MVGKRKTQIVVVGGGAGGLELVRKLGARFGRKDHDVVLIDKNLTHIWKPLLHEVAAGSLDANLDEVGYGGHANRWGYRYFNGEVGRIDREQRKVITKPLIDHKGNEIIAEHAIRYDYLVLAVGAVSNDFGIDGVKDNALFLESREQADMFRRRLLNECFRANHLHEQGDEEAAVSITIVGGGATGVELAAELVNAAERLKNYGLEVFDKSKLKVNLVEAGPRLLPALDEELSKTAEEELEGLGVAVLTDSQIKRVKPGVAVSSKGDIPSRLVVWAAGVKGSEAAASMSDLELNRLNQFVVRPTLQTKDDDRIFAIGDCCSCQLADMERPVPPRAQAAHQMAECVFKNLVLLQQGKDLEDFEYRDKGSLVSLSRFAAVGSLMGNLVGGRMAIEGRLARLAYLSLYRLHIMAIHGWLRGMALIVVAHVNQIVRPNLKLH
ncbi:MAG: NAD(P)/FAD-dependent oxidoreductase [Pseudomonadota bacterium]